MSKLDRIQIKGFKSIKDLDLELTNLNIFIGANASGKSNFIQFLQMLNMIVNKRLQNYVSKKGGADRLLFYGRKTMPGILVKLTCKDIWESHFAQWIERLKEHTCKNSYSDPRK